MEFREATVEDATAIAEVHVASWRTTYKGLLPDDLLAGLSVESRAEMWRQAAELAGKDSKYFAPLVAEDPDQGIVGFAHVGRERETESGFDAELYAIYVLRTHQGRGIGRQLFLRSVGRLLERGHNSMRLWVLEGNPAQRFYERMGGQMGESKGIEIGGTEYSEVSYSWSDISNCL